MAGKGFRKQLIGFKRQDVIECLDVMADSNELTKQENIKLRKQLEAASIKLSRLEGENSCLTEENAEMTKKLELMSIQLKSASAQLAHFEPIKESNTAPITVEKAESIADTLLSFPKLCQAVLSKLIK